MSEQQWRNSGAEGIEAMDRWDTPAAPTRPIPTEACICEVPGYQWGVDCPVDHTGASRVGAAPRAEGHVHEWVREYAPNYRQVSEANDWREECACGAFRSGTDDPPAAPRAEGLDWRAGSRRHDLLVVAANLMERWRDMPSDLFENEQAANARLRRERDKWIADYHDHAAALASRPSNEREGESDDR